MRLAQRLAARFPDTKYDYRIADSLKVTLAAAWLHFWWWPLSTVKSPPVAGSFLDWAFLIAVGMWFATPVASLVALAFIPRDLLRWPRWWQVLAAVTLSWAVVNSALHWTP